MCVHSVHVKRVCNAVVCERHCIVFREPISNTRRSVFISELNIFKHHNIGWRRNVPGESAELV